MTGNGQETDMGESGRGEEANGRGRKKAPVGGEGSSVLRVLRRKKCRLDLALTISGTGGKEVWNWHSGECPRPTWTWASSRRRSALMGSTTASRLDTASSLRTRRSDTAAEWPYSIYRLHFCGGGRPRVQAELHELQGRDGRAAVLHHRMLPRP